MPERETVKIENAEIRVHVYKVSERSQVEEFAASTGGEPSLLG